MNGLFKLLLAAALSLPAPWTKTPVETPEQYQARLDTIAKAIAIEAPNKLTAVTVLVVWYDESRFDRRIHAGEEHPIWTQDVGRARCLGQLHVSGLVPRAQWERLVGLDIDATRRCARATVRVLLAQRRLCRARGTPGLAQTLAAYASGVTCRPDARSRKAAIRLAAGCSGSSVGMGRGYHREAMASSALLGRPLQLVGALTCPVG